MSERGETGATFLDRVSATVFDLPGMYENEGLKSCSQLPAGKFTCKTITHEQFRDCIVVSEDMNSISENQISEMS